jgi:mRNA-degrading endonuclease HigB of HigAB toxin-antitoxin module
MIIATAGNKLRCVVLVDFTSDECWKMAQLADKKIMRIKAKN